MHTRHAHTWLVSCALMAHMATALAFPAGASTPAAAEIKKHLEGKVVDARLADGTTWRLEYKANGFFFINTSGGFNSNGPWSTEDGRLCGRLQGREHVCNDIRMQDGVMLYKRDNGEVVKFVPR
jgi:hypothetical protein